MTTGSIVVLGDVMTDIVVKMTEPVRFGSDTEATCCTLAGGSGANQAVWLASSGLDAHFVGCIGDDTFGRAHLEALAAAGVHAHCAVDRRRRTGMVIALVDSNGDRTMITDRGANSALAASQLPTDLFHAGSWFHLSGYTLLAPETRPAALAALELARSRGMATSVDPSSTAPLAAAGPENFLEWTAGSNLCFPNRGEGSLLTGERDEESIARELCRRYGGVALKLGSQGALWASADGGPSLRQPALSTPVVDTTGAGDAFCAGFLSCWLAGGTPAAALAQAVQTAAVAAGCLGGRPPGSYWPL